MNIDTIPAAERRAYIQKLIDTGLVGFTRCPDGRRQSDSMLSGPKGHAMPADLDPRNFTVDDGPTLVSPRERTLNLTTKAARRKVSRKIRRAI